MFPFLVIRCGLGDSLIPFSFPGMDGLMLRVFPSFRTYSRSFESKTRAVCARASNASAASV